MHACNNLGNFYRKGKVVDKDSSKAIMIFEKAYCLGSVGKPYRNRQNTIKENELQTYTKDEINCVGLQIDESMNTSGQVDDESAYQ